MRKSSLKEKLTKGEKIYGCDIQFYSPFVVELIGAAGFDFVNINCEYSSITDAQVEDMCRAAEARNLTPIAQVRSEGEFLSCRRLLDRGAMGIIMPNLRTRQDAEKFVRACKYVPNGDRDQCAFIRSNDFGTTRTPKEYSAFANQEILTIAMAENKDCVDTIEEIASVPGLDVIYVGAGNLSAEHGWPGPDVMAPIINKMGRAVIDAGKILVGGGRGGGGRHGTFEVIQNEGRVVMTGVHDTLRRALTGFLEDAKGT